MEESSAADASGRCPPGAALLPECGDRHHISIAWAQDHAAEWPPPGRAERGEPSAQDLARDGGYHPAQRTRRAQRGVSRDGQPRTQDADYLSETPRAIATRAYEKGGR